MLRWMSDLSFQPTAAALEAWRGRSEAEALALLGLVLRVERETHELLGPNGRLEAVWPAGKHHKGLAAPVVGDFVLYVEGENGNAASMLRVVARKNALARAVRRGNWLVPQVLSANLDELWIVMPPEKTEGEKIMQYLQLCHHQRIEPLLLLSKCDLDAEGRAAQLQALLAEIEAAGLPRPESLAFSARTGEGLPQLRDRLRAGLVVATLGPSGAGKTSLLNALGGATSKVGDLSEAHGEGRHTTTWREMHPLQNGAWLIDNPGVRELALWEDDPTGAFPTGRVLPPDEKREKENRPTRSGAKSERRFRRH